MQESDLLDMLPDGEAGPDASTDHIMLVSLGCFCGPKLSFKHIGRGAETLPFDWMRTRGAGILKFIREDFEGFFDFVSKKPVPGCSMTTYRGYHHSFWHDDPSDPGMRTRYRRRIARFKEMESRGKPILFVRTIPTTDELAEVPELVQELVTRYGSEACLLLIIDFQVTAPGPGVVQGLDNLLIYFLTGSHHVNEDGAPAPPYGKPILFALDWMVGRQVEAMRFPDMAKVAACADETHWGLQGLGGLNAFEASQDNPLPSEEEDAIDVSPSWAAPARVPPLRSQELECRLGEQVAKVRADGISCISLGCSPATKTSLQELGLGCEELPFDWAHVSHDGLLHFLHRGLDAPIREGLGAGGQRPSETVGFLDIATRSKVPNSSQIMCRSHLHSFWHDDLAEPDTRAQLGKRMKRWEAIGCKGEALLFVRAVATTAELARADELLSALKKRFGHKVCLLLVVDFQESNPGVYIVEGFDDLLVYLFEASAHQEDAWAPYRRPIAAALDWVQGEALEASAVDSLEQLQGLADGTNWGLVGPGGLRAFEGSARNAETAGAEGAPSDATAENAWLEEAKFEAAKDSFALISLGCHPGVAIALNSLGLGAEECPFDTLQIRLAGVVHFLLTAFKEFFSVDKTQAVPGTTLTMRRSRHHTFLDQFPEASWQEAYRPGIDNWYQLAKSSRPKLFVYAMADTEELDQVGLLLEELMVHFGRSIYVVVIVGGQEVPRVVSIDGNYNLLVHFITEAVHTRADPQQYHAPLRASLDWAVGRPLKASVVKDVSVLRSLARASAADLSVPGGPATTPGCGGG
uniref:Uncharacterized protein n=1 Tax=Zooxanthella nutricula TaxID=1333877 RepID=A0A7S2Q1F8_9DINO